MIVAKKLVLQLVDLAFTLYIWLIMARVILSWIPIPSGEFFNSIYQFIYELTEPVLVFFRKMLPSLSVGSTGFDFSPIIVLVILEFLHRFVLKTIFWFFINF